MHKKWVIWMFASLLAATLTACQPAPEAEPEPTPLSPTLPPTQLPTDIPPTEPTMPTPTLIPPTPTRRSVPSLIEWADLGTGKGPAYSQDWSPDGLLLATADTDQIRLWNTSTRRETGVLTGHTDFTWGLAWSPMMPDGTSILASANSDGYVKLGTSGQCRNGISGYRLGNVPGLVARWAAACCGHQDRRGADLGCNQPANAIQVAQPLLFDGHQRWLVAGR